LNIHKFFGIFLFMEEKKSKTNSFISLLGLLLLLLGIYMAVRTGTNLIFFKKYPTTGVMPVTPFFGGMPYSQREEDCMMSYPQTYFKENGQPRAATKEDKKMEEQQKNLCISGVVQAREAAKINDISTSLLFVFLGLGVLIGRKFF